MVHHVGKSRIVLNSSAYKACLWAACASLIFPLAACANTYTVTQTSDNGTGGTSGSLSWAIDQANASPGSTINFNLSSGNTVTIGGVEPIITTAMQIDGGNNVTINGQNAYRLFFVNAANAPVQISGLTLSGGLAQGGNGGGGYGGGGGGAGLGGAIFLNSGDLTVSDVSFSGNSAHGGEGSPGLQIVVNPLGGGGGGGGMNFPGGAGGGAANYESEAYYGPGGGGGALTSAGEAGNPNASRAGSGGGVNGGLGGLLGVAQSAGNGASPMLADGGGGGGGLSASSGYEGNATGGNGGNGSDFSGGGGAGSSDNGDGGLGGNGGFGGGGGGGALSTNGLPNAGGNGGFGGGGGGGGSNDGLYSLGGAGGFGGGNASGVTSNAGGGLGAGGAIFARAGSTLTVSDSTFTGDGVAGGSAAYPASAGTAIGQSMFLGGNVNYSVSAGTTTLSETIGGGNDTDARGNFTKSGAGTLVLSSAESYGGSTTISAGTLRMADTVVPSSTIQINANAVLEYNDTVRQYQTTTTYTGSGTLRVSGTGGLAFGVGPINVDLSAGAWVDIQSGELFGSASYNGIWTGNQASMNIASGAVFDAVESGPTGTMQIDALTGAGTFQGGYFGNDNDGLTTVTIGVAGGSGTFTGTLLDDQNAELAIVKTGSGTETLAGTNSYSGSTTVSAGTLSLGSNLTATSDISVAGGATLQLQHNAAINTSNLTLAPGATLDITDNSETFNTTIPGQSAATLLADLRAGYDHGHWNGISEGSAVITSSLARESSGVTTLGYKIDGNSFEIAYTLPGDTDLNGVVNAADLSNLSNHIGWDDFNYDGQVNADDSSLFMLGAAYGTVPPTLAPEPGMLLLMSALVAGVRLRKRRPLPSP